MITSPIILNQTFLTLLPAFYKAFGPYFDNTVSNRFFSIRIKAGGRIIGVFDDRHQNHTFGRIFSGMHRTCLIRNQEEVAGLRKRIPEWAGY